MDAPSHAITHDLVPDTDGTRMMITFPEGEDDYAPPESGRGDALAKNVLTRVRRCSLLCDQVYLSLSEIMGSYGFFYLFRKYRGTIASLYRGDGNSESVIKAVGYEDDVGSDQELILRARKRRKARGSGSQLPSDQEDEHAMFLADEGLAINRIDREKTRHGTNSSIAEALDSFVGFKDANADGHDFRTPARSVVDAVNSQPSIPLTFLGNGVKACCGNPEVTQRLLDYLKIKMVWSMAKVASLRAQMDYSMVQFESHRNIPIDQKNYIDNELTNRYRDSLDNARPVPTGHPLVSPVCRRLSEIADSIPFQDVTVVRRDPDFVSIRNHLARRSILDHNGLAAVVQSLERRYVPNGHRLERSLETAEIGAWSLGLVGLAAETIREMRQDIQKGDWWMPALRFCGLFAYAVADVYCTYRILRIVREWNERRRNDRRAIEYAILYPEFVLNTVCQGTFPKLRESD